MLTKLVYDDCAGHELIRQGKGNVYAILLT